eukprot:scaffold255085_cov28-Tisochrysis_lutea.AAC.2
MAATHSQAGAVTRKRRGGRALLNAAVVRQSPDVKVVWLILWTGGFETRQMRENEAQVTFEVPAAACTGCGAWLWVEGL